MAASWWKYGLCVFTGLGIGYIAGVKITKNRSEEEYDQKVADIREMYRNERKASKPKNKPEEPADDKPEITTKTSIQMEKLSEKKERAEQASNVYSKAFNKDPKPGTVNEDDDDDDESKDWADYIHLVSEFPENSPYQKEVLKYYADGVLAYQVQGNRIDENEIPHLIGVENLRLLEEEDCNTIYVRNDLYHINYTVIFCYEKWSEVIKEEPYKAEI